jgi:hypothetical protein
MAGGIAPADASISELHHIGYSAIDAAYQMMVGAASRKIVLTYVNFFTCDVATMPSNSVR